MDSVEKPRVLAVTTIPHLSAPPERNGDAAPTATAGPAPDAPDGAAASLDPAVAALCQPISADDPCGPDLDFDGDADYLNYFARVEGVLPTSFFSREDGKPFDRATIDLPGEIEAMAPLLKRTRDIRLLIMRGRLMVLNRDLGGFAWSVAAVAEWLEKYWDTVHPRAHNGDWTARQGAISVLDLPTVVFPLQYMPLLDAGRAGTITYRGWMIANGEVKERSGETRLSPAAIVEARSDADPSVLEAVRRHAAMLKTSLDRIRNAFAMNGMSAGLENLPTLAGKVVAFLGPEASARAEAPAHRDGLDVSGADANRADGAAARSAGAAPTSLTEAGEALAAIADYYSRSEPSSPSLPLVRQAHQLIGKSFFEVMSVLVPAQIEKAAFQIGAEQYFELPVGKLSQLLTEAAAAEPPPAADAAQLTDATPPGGAAPPRYHVESRSQALALLEQVQRYFRHNEPSSPVPMLCERARSLAERDFMSVLRDVLPKSALKTTGADK